MHINAGSQQLDFVSPESDLKKMFSSLLTGEYERAYQLVWNYLNPCLTTLHINELH